MSDAPPPRREYSPEEREALRLPEAALAAETPATPPPQGRTVRRSLALAGRLWVPVALLALLVELPVQLLTAFADRSSLEPGVMWDPDASAGTAVGNLLALLDAAVVYPLMLGAVLLLYAGHGRDPVALLKASARRYPQVFCVSLLSVLAFVLPMLPGGLLLGAGMAQMEPMVSPDAPFTGPGTTLVVVGGMLLLAAIIPSVFLAMSFTLAPRLAVVERLGPLASLKESYRRMRGQRLRVAGACVGLAILLGLPAFAVMAAGLTTAISMGPEGGWTVQGLVLAFLAAVSMVGWGALLTVVTADTAPVAGDSGTLTEAQTES